MFLYLHFLLVEAQNMLTLAQDPKYHTFFLMVKGDQ